MLNLNAAYVKGRTAAFGAGAGAGASSLGGAAAAASDDEPFVVILVALDVCMVPSVGDRSLVVLGLVLSLSGAPLGGNSTGSSLCPIPTPDSVLSLPLRLVLFVGLRSDPPADSVPLPLPLASVVPEAVL